MTTLRQKVKAYLGVDETTPKSVSVHDYVASHKTEVGPAVKSYLLSLFPFIQWVPRYNLTWLYYDLVA